MLQRHKPMSYGRKGMPEYDGCIYWLSTGISISSNEAPVASSPKRTSTGTVPFKQWAAVRIHLKLEFQERFDVRLRLKKHVYFMEMVRIIYSSFIRTPSQYDHILVMSTKNGKSSGLLRSPLIILGWIENPLMWTRCSTVTMRNVSLFMIIDSITATKMISVVERTDCRSSVFHFRKWNV